MLNFIPERRIFYFILAGIVGYIVDVSTTTLVNLWLFNPLLSRIPAFLLAATATWAINRKFTFRGLSSGESISKEYIKYLALMLAGAVVNYAVYAACLTLITFPPYSIPISIGIGGLAGMVVNYLLSKSLLYKFSKNEF